MAKKKKNASPEEKLRALNLSHEDIRQAVLRSSLNIPAGRIKQSGEEIKIRLLARRYWAKEFRDIVVKALPDGERILLKDIATIKEQFDDETSSISLFNGKNSIMFQVLKTGTEDSISISKTIHEYVATRNKSLPEGLELSIWSDNSRMIKGRIDLLTRNGLIGLVLVFITLALFLDPKLGFWATLGIPISFSGAFIVMYLAGMSLNMVSLFALILVLGIIVDDAIIVGESVYIHLQEEDSHTAILRGVKDVFWPVTTAVLTTIVAFMPLYFVDGTMGKFIGDMPTPIIAALAISLVEAIIILPVHLRHLKTKRTESKFLPLRLLQLVRRGIENGLVWLIDTVYQPVLRFALHWRYCTLAFATSVILTIGGLIAGNFIRTESFPSSDTDFILANAEMPSGTTLERTHEVNKKLIQSWKRTAKKLEERTGGKELTRALYTLSGGQITAQKQASGSHLGSVFIELLPTEERNISYEDILELWNKETGDLADVENLSFDGLVGGPPRPDIEYSLQSKSAEDLKNASIEFKAALSRIPGVYEIKSDFQQGKKELRLKLKDSARHLGLSNRQVAQQVRDAFYGAEVMRLMRGLDEVKIMVRYDEKSRQSLSRLHKMKVRNDKGQEFELAQVATFSFERDFAKIIRENGLRSVNVKASVQKGTDANIVRDELQKTILKELQEKYDITIKSGKNTKDNADSKSSMMIGFGFALLVIYLILSTIFRSYIQPVIIMLTIPFGLIGAILGHYFFDIKISLMSFFGFVALTGIVVNDSIVLIEAVNKYLSEGKTFIEALVEGAKRRFRAIILTTLTTFVGIFPMVMEKSLQAQVLIPMAVSVAFGVIFATFATLLIVPCLFHILSDLRLLTHIFFKAKSVDREVLEPRSPLNPND